MQPIDLSDSQKNVIKELVKWYNNPTQYITVGGYAGTGKTTMIGYFRSFLYSKLKKSTVAFCSYTGKAVRVLEQKLNEFDAVKKNDSVSTIHSLIYEPRTNNDGEIIGWSRRDELTFDLLIVDEASMIDQNIWNDLLAYKIPIIAVGDHGQLPPINGSFNLMEEPNLVLEEIFRQEQNNPIIELSITAREQKEITPGKYAPTVKKLDKTDSDTFSELQDLLESDLDNTLILCGFNATRVKLNRTIRENLERFSDDPVVGDRVICLKNNHEKHIANGMIGTITSIEPGEEDTFLAEIEMDNGVAFKGAIDATTFNDPESSRKKASRDTDLFDFGYALTVHKAQGSQAKRVILFEERSKYMDDDTWFRWLYTGITRAEKELYIIG